MVSVAKLSLTVPPLLSRFHVDRADELRADDAALDAAWPTAKVLRIDPRGRFDLDDTALVFARGHEIAAQRPAGAVLLGRVDGALVFALRVDLFDGAELRMRGHLLSPVDSALLAEALGILNWHATASFSPVDGVPTSPGKAGWVRATADGREEFPRTDAAMITLVHDGADQILLGRQHQWPERLFSLFAGFVEPGESLEQCVARELHEEAGIEVDQITYVASQPWPFPRSLMLGFTARANREAVLDFRDGEIAEAQWFSRLQVREALAAGDWSTDAPDAPLLLPNSISIARAIVETWAAAST